jgi:hypothetical protein
MYVKEGKCVGKIILRLFLAFVKSLPQYILQSNTLICSVTSLQLLNISSTVIYIITFYCLSFMKLMALLILNHATKQI